MKPIWILALGGMLTTAAFGEVQTYSTNVTLNSLIRDNNANGLATGITVDGLNSVISSVSISLDITGGFNGDLYAYLAGPTGGFSVLLNRTGVGGGNPFGYSDQGFSVTFNDLAANGSIHYYQNVLNPGGGQLTGTWQPDGEAINPQSAPAGFSGTQTAMLSSFNQLDGNGQWVFFIADLSPGGQSTLGNIGLTITTVPEPSTLGLAVAGGLALLGWRRKNVKTR